MDFDVSRLIERGIERGLDKEVIKEAIRIGESIDVNDLIKRLSNDKARQVLYNRIVKGDNYAVSTGGVTYKGEPVEKDRVLRAINNRIQKPIDGHVLSTIIDYFYS